MSFSATRLLVFTIVGLPVGFILTAFVFAITGLPIVASEVFPWALGIAIVAGIAGSLWNQTG